MLSFVTSEFSRTEIGLQYTSRERWIKLSVLPGTFFFFLFFFFKKNSSAFMIVVVCTVILAFGRLRKEDSYKLEASLGYMVTLCLKPLQKISIL